MLDNSKIVFEERYDSEEYKTTTFYFIAPKELVCAKYPEAEHTEICIECPTVAIESYYASVMFSPVRYSEEECGFVDYDWFDVSLTYGEIDSLIDLALNNN